MAPSVYMSRGRPRLSQFRYIQHAFLRMHNMDLFLINHIISKDRFSSFTKVNHCLYCTISTQIMLAVKHYNDIIMSAVASQVISFTIVYSIVDSDVDQRKHQSSESLAFVRGIHRGPVKSPHKCPVTRKMFPFDDVIMGIIWSTLCSKLRFIYNRVRVYDC